MTSAADPQIRVRAQRLLAELLGMDEPLDWSTIKYQETPEWDSLVQMAVVAELEAALPVSLTPEDIFEMISLDRIVALLESKGNVGR